MCNDVFNGPIVTLLDMLSARDERAKIHKKFLMMDTTSSLLCATMNIPGSIKTSEVLEDTFKKVIVELESTIKDMDSYPHLYRNNSSGYEFYLLVPLSKEKLKEIMVTIEENFYYGRLVDLDVLYMESNEVKVISRQELGYPKRQCFVCSKDAKVCARSKNHTLTEIQEKIIEIIEQKG